MEFYLECTYNIYLYNYINHVLSVNKLRFCSLAENELPLWWWRIVFQSDFFWSNVLGGFVFYTNCANKLEVSGDWWTTHKSAPKHNIFFDSKVIENRNYSLSLVLLQQCYKSPNFFLRPAIAEPLLEASDPCR